MKDCMNSKDISKDAAGHISIGGDPEEVIRVKKKRLTKEDEEETTTA